ncbi:MAG TPA: fatty acid desaturase [Mycobacteriales bacterium]|nr:fatty acid desaturase [Mycobacteriales bacterium]
MKIIDFLNRHRGTATARTPSVRREAWLGWATYACAVHIQLLALAVVRLGPVLLGAQILLLGATLASALLSVVHDAGHSEFSRRSWLNVLAAQVAVPMGLWVGHYRVKHRVHHSQSSVYAVDESTTPHPLLRVHPQAPCRPWHRYQHLYAPALYSVAWVGDVRSQVRYLCTGVVGTARVGSFRSRAVSYTAEKALTVTILLPYVWLAGPVRSAVVGAAVMAVASLFAALVLIAGHVNVGLVDEPDATFVARAFTTTAAFATTSPWMRRVTGGLTHHHVHHLRPHAPRSTFSTLHVDLIAPMAVEHQLPLIEFPTLSAAVAGHFRSLRQLGVIVCDQASRSDLSDSHAPIACVSLTSRATAL